MGYPCKYCTKNANSCYFYFKIDSRQNCEDFIPKPKKETKMEKEIFKNEEIIDMFLKDCVTPDLHNYVKNQIKQSGYIKKSELQTLVDEAEEIWRIYFDFLKTNSIINLTNNQLYKLFDVFQALKKSHPEFNK